MRQYYKMSMAVLLLGALCVMPGCKEQIGNPAENPT